MVDDLRAGSWKAEVAQTTAEKIENADILLDDDARKYISQDDKNQCLIIGRNPRNLFATKENFFELVSKKKGNRQNLIYRHI